MLRMQQEEAGIELTTCIKIKYWNGRVLIINFYYKYVSWNISVHLLLGEETMNYETALCNNLMNIF